MKKNEILQKAIDKAKLNGFKLSNRHLHASIMDNYNKVKDVIGFESIIFDHNFAKALWRDEDNTGDNPEPWKWHLQQMVSEEDPIKYLEEFL